MKKGKYIIISGLIILLISIIGLSYAYWMQSETQKDFNEIGSKCFELTMVEDNDGITLDKAHPVTDEDGMKEEGYTFTIKNTCNTLAYYQVNLEEMGIDTKSLPEDYIKLSLNDSNGRKITEYETVNKTIDNAIDSHKLTSGSLEPDDEVTYTLKLWMDYDTPAIEDVMHATYESKISVIASEIEEEKLENTIEVTSESENETYSKEKETFIIKATSKNYNIIEYSFDGVTYQPITPSKEVTIEKEETQEGTYQVYFKDEVGNIQEKTYETSKLDQTGPKVDFAVSMESEEGENDWYKKLILKSTFTDLVGVKEAKYCISTEECNPENIIELQDKEYEIEFEDQNQAQKMCIWSEDELGNETTICSEAYKVDGTSPNITKIENESEESWTKEDVILNINIEEEASGNVTCEEKEEEQESYTKIEGSYENNVFTTFPYSKTQNRSLQIRCKDEAGNLSETKETTIKIDQTDPEVKEVSVTKEKRNIIVEVEAEDTETNIQENGYNYSLIRDGTKVLKVTSQSKTYTFTNLEMGSPYKVEVSVEDKVGNIGTKESEEVEVPVVILGKEMTLTESGEGLYKVRHDEVTETLDDSGFQQAEYRYAGSNPNNYIWFNCDEGYTYGEEHCEKWRIVGLVNVMTSESKAEQRVKIVREKDLGPIIWDLKEDLSSSNNWNGSTLSQLLNESYYNRTNETYQNCNQFSEDGSECLESASVEAKFSETGIKTYSQKMIEEVYWNIATPDDERSDMFNLENTPIQYYTKERGTNVRENYPNIWKGKIGLLYPSDYGYTTSGVETGTTRNSCFSITLIDWHNSNNYTDCYQNTWIYNPNTNDYWTMISSNYNNISVIRIMNTSTTMNGALRNINSLYTRYVLPVLYLKDNVEIINGTGSETDPYRATLNGEQVSIDILGKEVPIVKENDGMYKVTHENVTGTINDPGFQQTEYRYAGVSPNNYVWFNCDNGYTSGIDHCEKWRIVGLVNVMTSTNTVEQRVKISKEESIGHMAWDSENQNDWTKSSLMNNLNTGDYYNKLKDSAKKMINKVYWNLGWVNTIANLTDPIYQQERSNAIANEQAYLWEGNVGLLYASDYGYMTSGGSTTSRKSCLDEITLLRWHYEEENSDLFKFNYPDCYNKTWLYFGLDNETYASLWLLDRALEGKDTNAVVRIFQSFHAPNQKSNYNGSLRFNYASVENDVYPTIYLKDNIEIINGNGSESNPFQLSLNE